MANVSNSCAEAIEAGQLASSRVFRDVYSLFVFRFWAPVNLLFGVIGNGFSLPVMIRLSKSNKAFLLQTAVVANDLITCTMYEAYCLFVPNLRVPWNLGSVGLHQHWFLVKFGSLITQIGNMFITTGICFVLTTAFYRAYALHCPHQYYTIHHKKHMVGVTITCFSVGILTSLHDCFRYYVQYCPEMKMHYVSNAPLGQLFGALEMVRMFTRMGCILMLCMMAAVVSILYKKHNTQHAQLTSSNQNSQSSQQAVDSRLLTTLLAIQAGTLLAGYTPLVVFYITIYFPQWFPQGTIMFMWTFCDFTASAGVTWNFWFYAGISRNFRKMLRDVVFCRTNQVGPSGNTKGGGVTTNRGQKSDKSSKRQVDASAGLAPVEEM